MYFAESANGLIATESFPGEVEVLKTQIVIDSTNVLFEDAYNQLLLGGYIIEEEDEETKSKKSDAKGDGLIAKLKEAIKAVLDKIKSIFSKGEKQHLTADDFLNSETGQVMISEEYAKRCEEIDRDIAALRPFVSKISKLTDKDILEVEKICNRLDAKAHEKAPAVIGMGGAIVKGNVRGAIANKTANVLSNSISCLGKYGELLDEQMMLETSDPKQLRVRKRIADTVAAQSTYVKGEIHKWKKSDAKGKAGLRAEFVKKSAKDIAKQSVKQSAKDVGKGAVFGALQKGVR